MKTWKAAPFLLWKEKGGCEMDNYVITIARGFGSGGKQIGLRLSKKLGIPCYEKQILQMASDYSGINKSLFVKSDEKLNGKKIAMALNTTGSYLLGDTDTCERRSLDEIKNSVRDQLEDLTVEEKAELAWFILTPNKK